MVVQEKNNWNKSLHKNGWLSILTVTEVRRTDYPRYLLLPRYGNNSSGEVENTKLIKRVSYPNSESRNPNKPAYTQGTKVWWDVADTMDETGKWKTPDNFR